MTKINTIQDIKQYEKVSSRVSRVYIPIKTSDFVTKLSSDFTLKGGAQYRKGSTGHFVEMLRTHEDNVSLYIANSFDRTMALRLSFNYEGFVFGRIKQIHKGKSAKDMLGSVDDIKSWYNNAINAIDAMRVLTLGKTDMQILARLAFKSRGINSSSITNIHYNHKNALDFVMYLSNGIRDGLFTRQITQGIKELKPVTQATLLVQINSKIWNFLSANNTELFV